MIRRWRRSGYSRAAGTANDTDGLQTDVMRFMSILGICLMAVFALVQSLPLHDSESMQKDSDRSRLQEKIADQQHRAQALEEELRRLLSLVQQADVQKAEKERELSDARQRLTAVVDRVEQARAEQNRVISELFHLQQRLARGRDALATLQRSADDEAESLSTLQQQLHRETRELDEIRQKTQIVKRQHAKAQRRQAMLTRQRELEKEQRRLAALQREKEQQVEERRATEKPASTAHSPSIERPKPAPAKKGFTLRFASDAALQKQVAGGDVGLFAMADKQAWRLSLAERRPIFTDAPFPRWFHEMAASTVPGEYVKRLKMVVDPKAHASVVWGVQLPPATKQDIASLTRGRQGGDLVIAANGRVTLTGK